MANTNLNGLAPQPDMLTPECQSIRFARPVDSRMFFRFTSCLSILLVALCCVVSAAAADEDYAAAGIALIARHGGGDLIFLVRHHKRSWYEMPGGRRKVAGDAISGQSNRGETAYDTAIRECYEESRGYLRPERLREIVDPVRRLQDDKFVYFVARIDWFALSELPAAPAAEQQNLRAFHEAVGFAWVPLANVINSKDGTTLDLSGNRIEIRPQLKPRLIRAGASGWL